MSSDNNPRMAARLGKVIYWMCSGVAVLIVIGGAAGAVYTESEVLLRLLRGQQDEIAEVEPPPDRLAALEEAYRRGLLTPEQQEEYGELKAAEILREVQRIESGRNVPRILGPATRSDPNGTHTLAGIILGASFVAAGGFWVFGRAARYVLAGK